MFDPQTDTFTEAEPLLSPRMLHTAVVSPIGQVLLIGGYGSQAEGYIDPLRSVDIFDPETLTVASLSETPSGPMLGSGGARYGTEGVLICGGLILNSDNSITHSEKCDLIGVEGALNDADSLEVGLIWPRMVSLNDDSVLMTGGYLGVPGETYNQSARIDATERVFLFRDGSWSEVASMNNPRAQHAAVALPDGRVLVAGGTVFTTSLAAGA